jgi:hypothetical protein
LPRTRLGRDQPTIILQSLQVYLHSIFPKAGKRLLENILRGLAVPDQFKDIGEYCLMVFVIQGIEGIDVVAD